MSIAHIEAVFMSDLPPKDRWTVWTPLADAGVSRQDVALFWASQPFDLRLPNVGGNCWLGNCWLGNCDGCFVNSPPPEGGGLRLILLKAARDALAQVLRVDDARMRWQEVQRGERCKSGAVIIDIEIAAP